MRVLLFVLLAFLLSIRADAQRNQLVDIQRVALKDTVLVKEIENIIARESSGGDMQEYFSQGLGYIALHVEDYGFGRGDTLRRYYIAPQLYPFKKDAPDSRYPLFYAYVSNRLILIHGDALGAALRLGYSPGSKANIRKRVNATLAKAEDRTFYDMAGHKVFRDRHFQVDYFSFDNGLYVYVLKNKPPFVVAERDIRSLKK